MIDIFFGDPGVGKTCLITHLANTYAFDYKRTQAMQQELRQKINAGFTNIQTIPSHCVAANYDITLRKFRYSPLKSRRINPFRLGYANPYVKTHFSLPYEVYVITEAQKYFDSRMSLYYPDWQSRFFEQHRHNYLDFLLDSQRADLIDLNIRAISRFNHVVKLDIDYDRFGRPGRMIWEVRRIESCSLYDKYMSSGQRDKDCYTTEIITSDINIFNCYDSRSCKPRFYAGHFDEDIDYQSAKITDESLDGYLDFLKEFDDELPENFYIKRSEKGKK